MAFFGSQPQPKPMTVEPLEPSTAHLIGLGFACCYVGSLYISNRARLKFETNLPPRRARGNKEGEYEEEVQERAKLAHERWRDDPDVIIARLTMASLASLVCIIAVGIIVFVRSGADANRIPEAILLAAEYLGIWSSHWYSSPASSLKSKPSHLFSQFQSWASISFLSLFVRQHPRLEETCQMVFQRPCAVVAYLVQGYLQRLFYALRPHLILPLLFAGPLLATYLQEAFPFQRRWSWRRFQWQFLSLTGLRTYILGPITEEVVFRACVLAVSNMANLSKKSMVLWTPLVFGVAHLHHAWDSFNRYGRTKRALKVALISTLVQFSYTSLFGFLVAYLFINSGSLYPPITAHMFCNTMGLPNPIEEISRAKSVFWKAAIVVAYLGGLIGFYYGLDTWSTFSDGGRGVWSRYSEVPSR